MQSPHYRYFIELQPSSGAPVPRYRETEARRAAAHGFIEQMRDWIRERKLDEKVSALNITLLGQIQITCDTAVINLIRDQDDIAAIRQSAMYTETPIRWNEAY